MDNPVSDNPSPAIEWFTMDSRSGVGEARIFVNGIFLLATTSASVELPPQKPGKHVLTVRVFDAAGNSREATRAFEILPLENPVIDFVTRYVPQGEEIFLSGTAPTNTTVAVALLDERERQVLDGESIAGSTGEWAMRIDARIPAGAYRVSVVAKDSRGAESFPVDAGTIKIGAKRIVAIGPIEAGWFEIFLTAVLVVFAAAGAVAWRVSIRAGRRRAYREIVGRDIDHLSTLLLRVLDELEELEEVHIPSQREKAREAVAKMRDAIRKMKRYLSGEVEKIR